MDPRLIEYIQKCLSRGLAPQQIRHELIKAGWESKQIGDAIDEVFDQSVEKSPVSKFKFWRGNGSKLDGLPAGNAVKESISSFSPWKFIKVTGIRFRVAAFLIFAAAGLILVFTVFSDSSLRNIRNVNLPFVKKEPTITKIGEYNSKDDGEIKALSPKRTKVITEKRVIGCGSCQIDDRGLSKIIFDSEDKAIYTKYLANDGEPGYSLFRENSEIKKGRIINLVSSSDHKHFAYALMDKGSVSVYLDNKEVNRIDNRTGEWRLENITFSKKGKNIAYTLRGLGKELVIVDNNRAGKPYEKLEFPYGLPMELSPDGQHVGYSVGDSGREGAFVVDDKEYNLSDQSIIHPLEDVSEIQLSSPFYDLYSAFLDFYPNEGVIRFSPDSERYAFRGINRESTSGSGQHFLVVDGREERFSKVISPVFSEDSKRVAYFKEDGEGKGFIVETGGKKEFVNVDYDYVYGLTFTKDNKLAYLAHTLLNNKHEFFVVFGDKKSNSYDRITNLRYSRDKSRYAFMAMANEDIESKVFKNKLIIDGNEIDEQVLGFQFSPDGKHYAYFKTDNTKFQDSRDPEMKKYLVVDGEKYIFDGYSVELQPSSDNVELKLTGSIWFGDLNIPVFSEDSKEVRYNVIKDNAIYLVTIPT